MAVQARGRAGGVGRRCDVRPARDLVRTFRQKIDRSGGADVCWPWTGPRKRSYGSFKVNDCGRRRVGRAHRLAWTLANGPIPDGLCILHRCDNPPCCNPSHLFLGTQLDNIRDRDAKGRGGHGDGSYPQACGEMAYGAKLTEQAVRQIRIQAVSGCTYAEIASHHNVSAVTARNVAVRISWKHVA